MSKKKVCIYCRAALKGDADIEQLIDYAQNKGFEVVHTISEYGSGSTIERNGIKEMISRATNKEFDAVVIKDISRIARSVDALNVIEELTKCGIEVLTLNG